MALMSHHFPDLRDAIMCACGFAPACIGYRKSMGWFVYDPVDGCPSDAEPEFFIARRGTHPFPLTRIAAEAWLSAITASALNN